MAWVAALAVVVFLLLGLATKVIRGNESFTYYHHILAILGLAALALHLTGEPILHYLDLAALGLGAFTVAGRIGCLMVGCCHGRPSRRGPKYRQKHAEAGFPEYLVGVRLIPIQLVEAAWVAVIVAVGTALLVAHASPGVALALYLLAYGLGRFAFEQFRGDAGRPYLLGFSEAQWTALAVAATTAAVERSGGLPTRPWGLAVAITLAGTMVIIATHRWLSGSRRHRLLSARHIREIAEAVKELMNHSGEPLPPKPGAIAVAETSQGLRISRGVTRDGAVHYALSFAGIPLRSDEAKAVAEILSLLRHGGAPLWVVPGNSAVFHVLTR